MRLIFSGKEAALAGSRYIEGHANSIQAEIKHTAHSVAGHASLARCVRVGRGAVTRESTNAYASDGPTAGTDLPSWNGRQAIDPNLHVQAGGEQIFQGGSINFRKKLFRGGTNLKGVQIKRDNSIKQH